MRLRLPIVVSMVIGFVVGAGGGILAARVGSLGKEAVKRHRPTKEETLEKLTKELGLNATQRDSLNAILDEGGRRMKELSQTVSPQFRSIKAQTRDRIREILDAGQRERFERIVEDQDRQREAQRKSGSVTARGAFGSG